MGTLELLAIAIGVSMDAFAVAICQGLSAKKMSYKYAITTGCFFGGFQALMPSIGYLLGTQFKDYIISIDHWIIFILLSIIGIKMIKESRGVCMVSVGYYSLKSLLVLSLATSIDALAIGVTFAFLHVNLLFAVSVIGITTFIFSFIGVKIGNILGEKFQAKAEMAGGIILIAMGTKILLEHLHII